MTFHFEYFYLLKGKISDVMLEIRDLFSFTFSFQHVRKVQASYFMKINMKINTLVVDAYAVLYVDKVSGAN